MSGRPRSEFSAHGVEGRRKRSCRIQPAGAGTLLAKWLDGLDELPGVFRAHQSVVDLVLHTIWIAGPFGKTLRQGGSIHVEYELVELRAVSLSEPLQVLDECGSGEVLAHDDVVTGAQLFAGERESQ